MRLNLAFQLRLPLRFRLHSENAVFDAGKHIGLMLDDVIHKKSGAWRIHTEHPVLMRNDQPGVRWSWENIGIVDFVVPLHIQLQSSQLKDRRLWAAVEL
jgi:hypothetical protein